MRGGGRSRSPVRFRLHVGVACGHSLTTCEGGPVDDDALDASTRGRPAELETTWSAGAMTAVISCRTRRCYIRSSTRTTHDNARPPPLHLRAGAARQTRFQVHFFELQPDNHTVKRALITFEQHCEGGPALLSGCIHIE